MTPGARVAAAIEILDAVFAGMPAEKALTGWARKSRFAGSKDRAAVRDWVFDALRNLQSFQQIPGQCLGDYDARRVMIGAVRHRGGSVEDVFNGEGYSPTALSSVEAQCLGSDDDLLNLPDHTVGLLENAFGPEVAKAQANALCERAPVTIRCNTTKTTRAGLAGILRDTLGITSIENPISETALTLPDAPRGLTASDAFREGLFELQDASSQAIVDVLPEAEGPILDYCAGGGGKTLALAARYGGTILAHDADANRMKDVPVRSKRASASVRIVTEKADIKEESFGLVLCDAPCTGSGSWRRTPEEKWRFAPSDLQSMFQSQTGVLRAARSVVSKNGTLAYATCSIFKEENEAVRDWFLAEFPEWSLQKENRWWIDAFGDGFYLAQFSRA